MGNKMSNNNKTVTAISKQNTFEFAVVNLICFLVFAAFGYIAVMSFFQTSVFDAAQYANEKVIFQIDHIALNLFFTILFSVFIFKMKKHYDFFAKVNMKYMEIALAIYAVVIGFIWIFSVTAVPVGNSQNIFEAATGAVNGNYTPINGNGNFYNSAFYSGKSFFNYYPTELGFVFICEIIYRIFGTASSMPMQVVNVLCVAGAYLGIAKITKLLFKRRSVEFIAILLLAGCFQPILFSTLVYGNMIGMCCAVWASYFLIKYFQSSKYILLIPCGVLLVLSVIAKHNNLIYLVAFAVMLIIHTVKEKKWQSVAFALALCIASLGSVSLIIMSYEARANTKLSGGITHSCNLDMGLSDSNMAPGWYNGIAMSDYLASNLNSDAANKTAWSHINARLDYLGTHPNYAVDFFSKKILSQWNEPSFESIWVSKVTAHSSQLNFIGEGMYNKSLGQFFQLYFNLFMQAVYLLFAIGIYCLFVKKKTNIETVLFPLVLLGAFGYFLLFEAKSQYIVSYIILLIPTASFAMNTILEGKYTKVKEIVGKLKAIPEKKSA